jgi:hypothetical protein
VLCSKAAKSIRHKLPHQAVSTLAQMVARDKRMADDVSIIILDMLPPPAPGIMPQQFPASALKVGFLFAFLQAVHGMPHTLCTNASVALRCGVHQPHAYTALCACEHGG